MKKPYFIFWSDYDGDYTERFDTLKELEERYTQLAKITNSKDPNGTGVSMAGKLEAEYLFNPVETVTVYRAVEVK